MAIRVRASRRARAHMRRRYAFTEARPIDVRVNAFEPGVIASVHRLNPDVIELNNPPTEDGGDVADTYVRVLGHETLHAALQRQQEDRASLMLDSVRDKRDNITAKRLLARGWDENRFMPASYSIEKSGLHPAFPRRRKR
jgi:hypothetical protein